MIDKNGNPAVVLQAHDFYYKPEEFAKYSLYEFVCTVKREKAKKSEDKSDPSNSDSEEAEADTTSNSESDLESQPEKPSKPRGRGRPAFIRHDFHEDHPLYGLYRLECLALLAVHSNAKIVAKLRCVRALVPIH